MGLRTSFGDLHSLLAQVNFPLELVSKDGKKASLAVSVLAIEALHRLSQSPAS